MHLSLKIEERVVMTRERGRADRERLEAMTMEAAAGAVIVIDLSAVEAMTVSYADELIGRFLSSRTGGDQDDRGVIIRGSNDDVRETLEAVLDRRGVGAIYVDARGRTLALGGPAWFAKTVAQAQDLGVFRAAQLAERLDVSPQAANGRLRQLSAAGAVLRERVVPDGGGKEFEYRIATVPS